MKIAVPYDKLQPETLDALIEEFVTRDGAVHGHADVPIPQQIESMRSQLKVGVVVIVFDDELETCTICAVKEWNASETSRSSTTQSQDEI